MKKIILGLMLTMSSLTFAETHGGVMISNSLLRGVTNYALEQGGDLSRVLSVKKIVNTDKFEIVFGGQDSKTGKENVEYKLKVKANIKPDETGAIFPDGEVQIQEIK